MAETEHITVAETSAGRGGTGNPGEDVQLPVVELLTGRGFVTGKSGSGKSNSASVIAEKLLDNGFGILIVDIDGEYYGLKEEYEILHAGADEECDIQITADHAEKMASLALEQNVPIILDVSSFLDEDEAEAVLTAVAQHLFAKAKKQKQPFLMLVEEVHEYIPEGGAVGECGKMLIKIGKRGRKHGLGIVGISQRPADVKKDFITQCDWLVWHRLTWNNDTKVVQRILDGEYASAVEELDDGEGFLMTDWGEDVRRVQFHRKQTFDAGATPGLDDFERPELKSVSDTLVSELEDISEEKQARENRIADLREELDKKNSRIAELEAELQDARDMSRMADQFVDALVDHVEGPAPGMTEQERMRTRRQRTAGDRADTGTAEAADTSEPATTAEATVGPADAGTAGTDDGSRATDGGTAARPERDGDVVDAGTELDESADEDDGIIDGDESAPPEFRNGITGDGGASEYDIIDGEDDADEGGEPIEVRQLKADIAGMETTARRMLAFYREYGPETPLNAHFSAGGDGDRTQAYARNRSLRTRGLIEHVGRGRYEYRLRDYLEDVCEDSIEPNKIEAFATNIERRALDGVNVDDAD